MTELTMSDRTLYAARLLAFLGKHDASEAMLTDALVDSPDSALLLRHRGHRRITQRKFEGALADFSRASELIADQPDEHEFYQRDVENELIQLILGNEAGVREQHMPVNEETIAATAGMYKSTLHGSIWYHLALSKYLTGDYAGAFEDYGRAEEAAADDDLLVAIFDWRYMSLRRMGRDEEAQQLLDTVSTESLDVTATEDFYLRRLKLYKGELTPEEVLTEHSESFIALSTQGYGVGNWYLYNGDEEAAKEIFARVLEHGEPKAFAYMAAEVDMARLTSA